MRATLGKAASQGNACALNRSTVSEAQWINTSAGLDDWLAQLPPHESSAGIDTEFVRESTFYPRLALLQIAVGEAIALIDPLAFDAQALRVWLEAAPRACVLHSASEDIEALRDLLPHGPPHLFDTQIAAAFAGLGAGVGYQRLVSDLLGIDLPKDATRSDWTRRPLSAQQHAYAVQDVLHLHALHELLEAKLSARGYMEWFAEDCARLLRRADAPADAQPQRSFRSVAHWPDANLARLRALLLWRDAAARRWDVPRTWLLRDEHCADLTLDPPADLAVLEARTRGQRALRQPVRAELWEHLQQPVEAAFIAATQRPDDFLKGSARRAFDAMRERVDQEATRLDLPTGLLCPRRALERYIAARDWPAELHGWRRGLLQAQLAPLLP